MSRTVSRSVLVALLVTGLGTAPASAAPGPIGLAPGGAPTATSEDVTVKELDLAGVSPDAVGDLPDVAPAPSESAAAPDEPAAVPPPEGTPPSSPGAAATTAPGEAATPAETATPTATPTPAPGPDAPDPDVLTTELSTIPFTVFGVTWDPGPQDVVIRYRVRESGEWSGWEATGPSDVAPDSNRVEGADATTRGATDPIVADEADGVQIWAESGTGPVTGVKVLLIDPGTRPTDTAPQTMLATPTGRATAAPLPSAQGFSAPAAGVLTAGPAPAPPVIISRAGWGADESMRNCAPDYSTQMVSAAVHHTASGNGYSPDEVPGLLRGFYEYHTRSEAGGGRGWCDIGYNFLVDRFGRIFEGRAGGIDSTVVGVHTGGFNSRTIGVAAIGEYGAVGAPDPMVEAISQLIAWKFTIHGIYAGVEVTMVSGGGASKYPEGSVVSFPTIYAHRDAQLTSCPGANLYGVLPYIRARVSELANASVSVSPIGSWDSATTTQSAVVVSGWAADLQGPDPVTVEVRFDGTPVAQVLANGARPDVGAAYPHLGSAHGFSATVPKASGTSVVCLVALNIGDGRDRSLGCRTMTVRNAAPIGSVDSVAASGTTITVTGWTLDPDTSASNEAHVYVDGVGVALVADRSRPDLVAVYGRGDRHGFTHTRTVADGEHSVCVFSIDTGGGQNTLVECRTVVVGTVVPRTPPVGLIDAVSASNTSITISGWAFDPDTAAPSDVHVYVDSAGYAITANRSRPDVGAVYGVGADHGYALSVPATAGPHTVCAFAINSGPGDNVLLGCRSVDVPDIAPIGVVDSITTTNTSLSLSGWTLDPDTSASNQAHVYVDGVGVALVADRSRADVAAVFGLGDRHGFTFSTPAAPGPHQVCVFGISSALGANTLLLCTVVVVPDAVPIGVVDSVTVAAGSLTVTGWTFDPDTSASNQTHIYVDGAGVALLADRSRPDVAAAYGNGDRHGFSYRATVAPGDHQVCTFGINTAAGPHTLLDCRVVRVP